MKTIKLLTATAVLISCMAAAPAHAEKKAESGTAKSQMSVSASEFLTMAASSDLFEIASSKLALQKSSNAQIRDFAQQMIKDHSKSRAKMRAALAGSYAPNAMPNRFTPKHAVTYNALNAASGKDFDTMYIKAQKEAHEEAVTLFTSYSTNGDDKALRDFAAQTLPTLQLHREHAGHFNMNTAAR